MAELQPIKYLYDGIIRTKEEMIEIAKTWKPIKIYVREDYKKDEQRTQK